MPKPPFGRRRRGQATTDSNPYADWNVTPARLHYPDASAPRFIDIHNPVTNIPAAPVTARQLATAIQQAFLQFSADATNQATVEEIFSEDQREQLTAIGQRVEHGTETAEDLEQLTNLQQILEQHYASQARTAAPQPYDRLPYHQAVMEAITARSKARARPGFELAPERQRIRDIINSTLPEAGGDISEQQFVDGIRQLPQDQRRQLAHTIYTLPSADDGPETQFLFNEDGFVFAVARYNARTHGTQFTLYNQAGEIETTPTAALIERAHALYQSGHPHFSNMVYDSAEQQEHARAKGHKVAEANRQYFNKLRQQLVRTDQQVTSQFNSALLPRLLAGLRTSELNGAGVLRQELISLGSVRAMPDLKDLFKGLTGRTRTVIGEFLGLLMILVFKLFRTYGLYSVMNIKIETFMSIVNHPSTPLQDRKTLTNAFMKLLGKKIDADGRLVNSTKQQPLTSDERTILRRYMGKYLKTLPEAERKEAIEKNKLFNLPTEAEVRNGAVDDFGDATAHFRRLMHGKHQGDDQRFKDFTVVQNKQVAHKQKSMATRTRVAQEHQQSSAANQGNPNAVRFSAVADGVQGVVVQRGCDLSTTDITEQEADTIFDDRHTLDPLHREREHERYSRAQLTTSRALTQRLRNKLATKPNQAAFQDIVSYLYKQHTGQELSEEGLTSLMGSTATDSDDGKTLAQLAENFDLSDLNHEQLAEIENSLLAAIDADIQAEADAISTNRGEFATHALEHFAAVTSTEAYLDELISDLTRNGDPLLPQFSRLTEEQRSTMLASYKPHLEALIAEGNFNQETLTQFFNDLEEDSLFASHQQLADDLGQAIESKQQEIKSLRPETHPVRIETLTQEIRGLKQRLDAINEQQAQEFADTFFGTDGSDYSIENLPRAFQGSQANYLIEYLQAHPSENHDAFFDSIHLHHSETGKIVTVREAIAECIKTKGTLTPHDARMIIAAANETARLSLQEAHTEQRTELIGEIHDEYGDIVRYAQSAHLIQDENGAWIVGFDPTITFNENMTDIVGEIDEEATRISEEFNSLHNSRLAEMRKQIQTQLDELGGNLQSPKFKQIADRAKIMPGAPAFPSVTAAKTALASAYDSLSNPNPTAISHEPEAGSEIPEQVQRLLEATNAFDTLDALFNQVHGEEHDEEEHDEEEHDEEEAAPHIAAAAAAAADDDDDDSLDGASVGAQSAVSSQQGDDNPDTTAAVDGMAIGDADDHDAPAQKTAAEEFTSKQADILGFTAKFAALPPVQQDLAMRALNGYLNDNENATPEQKQAKAKEIIGAFSAANASGPQDPAGLAAFRDQDPGFGYQIRKTLMRDYMAADCPESFTFDDAYKQDLVAQLRATAPAGQAIDDSVLMALINQQIAKLSHQAKVVTFDQLLLKVDAEQLARHGEAKLHRIMPQRSQFFAEGGLTSAMRSRESYRIIVGKLTKGDPVTETDICFLLFGIKEPISSNQTDYRDALVKEINENLGMRQYMDATNGQIQIKHAFMHSSATLASHVTGHEADADAAPTSPMQSFGGGGDGGGGRRPLQPRQRQGVTSSKPTAVQQGRRSNIRHGGRAPGSDENIVPTGAGGGRR